MSAPRMVPTFAALIAALEPEVRERLSAIDPAHDWFHVQRVRALAREVVEKAFRMFCGTAAQRDGG